MAITRLRLRPGVDAQSTSQALGLRIVELGNVTAQGGLGAGAADKLSTAYVEWVSQTEAVIRDRTSQPEVADQLLTDRYWHIRRLDRSTRPFDLVRDEMETQRPWLTALKADLDARVTQATGAPGHLTILDTNVLLHYKLPQEIPWATVVGQADVRLILPSRVIEELDEKKYSGSDKVADRARTALRHIEQLVGIAAAPGSIRDRVTLEILVDEGPRLRTTDADEEILNTADDLRSLTGTSPTIVTGDYGMRLRAQARNLPVAQLGEEHLRSQLAGYTRRTGE